MEEINRIPVVTYEQDVKVVQTLVCSYEEAWLLKHINSNFYIDALKAFNIEKPGEEITFNEVIKEVIFSGVMKFHRAYVELYEKAMEENDEDLRSELMPLYPITDIDYICNGLDTKIYIENYPVYKKYFGETLLEISADIGFPICEKKIMPHKGVNKEVLL